MAAKQNMIQAITKAAIDTAKVAIIVGKETENPVHPSRSVQIIPKTGSISLKQPTIN